MYPGGWSEWFKGLAALADDQSLIPIMQKVSHKHLQLQFSVFLCPLLIPMDTNHTHGVHTCRQNTNVHNIYE